MYLWLILVISFLFLPICNYRITIGQKNRNSTVPCQKNGKLFFITLVSVILVTINALRADSVGADTAMYHNLYDLTRSASSLSEARGYWQNQSLEVGFLFLEFVLGRFLDFHAASFVFAIISIVPLMVLIYKYSDNYWLSIFVYICFGMYAFSLTGLRQSVAMGLCCIAFIFAKKRKLVVFLLFVILAFTIHKSALIFLPAYWLMTVGHSKKTIGIFFLSTVASFGLGPVVYKLLNMFARFSYESSDSAGGSKLYLFIIGTLLLSYLVSKRFFSSSTSKEEIKLVTNENLPIFNMIAFCALLWPITRANSVVFRLYYYYFIYLALFIPNFINGIRDKKTKLMILVIYLAVGFYFLNFYIIGNEQMKYAAYEFFWQ